MVADNKVTARDAMRDAMRARRDTALDTLCELCRDDAIPKDIRLDAAKILLQWCQEEYYDAKH